MRGWWHRLWCGDCRAVRPARLDTFPNDSPLFVPFYWGIFLKGLPEFFNCPVARAAWRAEKDRAQRLFDATVLPCLRGK